MRRNYFDSGTGTVKVRDISKKKIKKNPRFNTNPKYMQKCEIDVCLSCTLPKCNGNCYKLREIDYEDNE